MATKYLRAAPIPGKFYVCQNWKAEKNGGDGILSQHQHDGQLDQMILAGPYDTRNEAENWNTKHANGHANIWQF